MHKSDAVAFYPDLPHPRTTVLKILDHLEIRYITDLSGHCVCTFKWRDTTVYELDQKFLADFPNLTIHNRYCTDISKRNVAKIHWAVFGRHLSVNPRTFNGLIVCKSNRNAAHDAVVVEGPLKKVNSNRTYSILINNTDGSEVIDYRVPIIRDTMPLVYIKRRPIEARFSNKNTSVVLSTPSDLFSCVERKKIVAFATAIGMDFGELDILRDIQTGLLSIVDANNTPFGPPNNLSTQDTTTSISLLSSAFRTAFLLR
jgi:hypothetical protein